MKLGLVHAYARANMLLMCVGVFVSYDRGVAHLINLDLSATVIAQMRARYNTTTNAAGGTSASGISLACASSSANQHQQQQNENRHYRPGLRFVQVPRRPASSLTNSILTY